MSRIPRFARDDTRAGNREVIAVAAPRSYFGGMKTEITEIADRIYRLSTFVPQVGPTGFTFNQFLIDAGSHCCSTTGIARCSR